MLSHLIGFHPSFSALILRIVLGIIFVAHGSEKLFKHKPKGVSTYFQGIGIPAPAFFAVVVILTEFLGGIFLVLGLLTRWAAAALTIEMLVALIMVRFKTGLITRTEQDGSAGGYELEFAFSAMAFVLLILGAGKFSIDWIAFQVW